jgi:hypothetical protein
MLKIELGYMRICWVFLLFFLNNSYSRETTSDLSLFSKERQGIKFYKKAQFKKAYKNISETAQWGFKDSQYFLALMYLKGQYVQQDIIRGMGYLGVANEAAIKNRKELFDKIYISLTPAMKVQVDARVEEYIGQIGMRAKSIKCSKSQDVGSRVPVINCNFYKKNIGGGEIE